MTTTDTRGLCPPSPDYRTAGTVTELLDRIGATHLDEACAVLWRQSEERNRLLAYLARALRGCDARERKAIETDMAAEVGSDR